METLSDAPTLRQRQIILHTLTRYTPVRTRQCHRLPILAFPVVILQVFVELHLDFLHFSFLDVLVNLVIELVHCCATFAIAHYLCA